MEKKIKGIICGILASALLFTYTVSFASKVAYDDDRIVIDVSKPENVSLPLVCRITDLEGNILYANTVDINGKRLVSIDLNNEDINVSLGGAINDSNCEITTVKELVSIEVGEYISLGGYLWLCVLIDENGPLMLCEETVKSMSFGEGSLWKDSDIKEWLDGEFFGGFLENYAIYPVRQKQTVTDMSVSLLTDGSRRIEFNHYPERMNNKNLYSYYVEDKFFIPDIVQVENISKNSISLRTSDNYWTRTPLEAAEYDNFLYSINKNGNVGIADSDEILAVRPAFYLNYSEIKFFGGNGTEESPYTIQENDNPYLLVSEKGFTESLTASAKGADGKLVIVFYDKDMRMVDLKTESSDCLTVDVPEGLSAKIFCWNGLGEMKPLTQGIEIINRGEWLK